MHAMHACCGCMLCVDTAGLQKSREIVVGASADVCPGAWAASPVPEDACEHAAR